MTTSKLKIVLWTSLSLSAAAAVLRCFLIKKFINSASDYTDYSRIKLTGTFATEIFPIIIVLLIVAFFIFSLLIKNDKAARLNYDSSATVFFASLTGFMALTTAAMRIYYYLSGSIAMDATGWAIIVLLLLSSVFFLITSSKNLKPRSPLYTVLSLMPVLLYLIRLLDYFLQINSRPNSATGLFHLFSLAAMMLFFVNEGKFTVSSGTRRFYIFFGLAAILLTCVYAVPELILSAFWVITWQTDTMLSALDLVICLFVAVRIISCCGAETEVIEND